MRREVQAVCLSGGTINNRFNNYLRNRFEDRFSGVIPKDAILRGIKKMTRLFSLTVKLMVKEVSPILFKCDNCDYFEGNPISAVCVDGIWAGFDRASSKPLISISEGCDSIPASRATQNRARPNSSLFRSDAVANILSAAIKSPKKVIIRQENKFHIALSALRALSPALIPESWSVESIFSHVKGSAEMDNLCSAFRDVTFTLFKQDIIIKRLTKAMTPLLEKRMHELQDTDSSARRRLKRRRTRKNLARRMSDKDLLSQPMVVSRIISYGQQEISPNPIQRIVGENGICWNDKVLAISADSRRTLYNFYMVILQGPLTQFILATETETLRNIANWFSRLGSTS